MRLDRLVHRLCDHDRRRWPLIVAPLLALAFSFVLAGAVAAQTSASPSTPATPATPASPASPATSSPAVVTAPPLSAQDQAKLTDAAADRLARNALLFLRSLEETTPEDYRAVALTLTEALALEPDDVELERLLLEAWHAAGDDAQVLASTRRLIRLDPQDTVAQLRLLSDRIGQLQNVEDREAIYDRLLDEGTQLDASVRSRLALDAAMLAREIGDEDLFVQRLTLSIQLDSTNKPAAMLAATYTLERLANPMARVEMLANVVLADPLDPSTHFGLAQELFSQGAYKNALRFYSNSNALRSTQGMPSSPNLSQRILFCSWALNGSQSMLDLLALGEKSARHNIKLQKDAAELAGEDTDQIHPYQPNPTSESLRLAAAIALGDTIESQAALDRLNLITAAALSSLQKKPEPTTDNTPQPTASEIEAKARQWGFNLLWQRLWSGLEIDKAAETIEKLDPVQSAGLMSIDTLHKYQGLLAAQRGDRESAIQLLQPLAATDEQARIGLGLAAEHASDQTAAIKQYAKIALDIPGSLYGVWARTRIQTLLNDQLNASPIAQTLNDYCDALPDEIDALVAEPRSLLHIEVKQVAKTIKPFDRLSVRIAVRNVSPIPLALGPDSPISSNLLLSPRLSIGAREINEQLKPIVISLNRRLRLNPGESIEATIWAGQGRVGALNDQALLNAALIRWRLVSGYVVTEDGQYQPTALSLSANSDIARRTPLEAPEGGLAQLPTDIRNAAGMDLIRLVTITPGAIQFVQQQVNPETALKLLTSIVDAIADRLPTMNRYERALLTQQLPTVKDAEKLALIEQTLRNDPDRLVRLFFLYQRSADPDDPIYALAQTGDDPIVAEIAAILRRHVLEQANDSATAAADGSSADKQQ